MLHENRAMFLAEQDHLLAILRAVPPDIADRNIQADTPLAAITAAETHPAAFALRALARDLGWLLWVRGGTQLMAQLLLATTGQAPDTAGLVDLWWRGIGQADDVWGAALDGMPHSTPLPV